MRQARRVNPGEKKPRFRELPFCQKAEGRTEGRQQGQFRAGTATGRSTPSPSKT
jgi:hypothetical protein